MLARNKNNRLYMERKRMATRLEEVEARKKKENKTFDIVILIGAVLTLAVILERVI
jgi:hypothetical protein